MIQASHPRAHTCKNFSRVVFNHICKWAYDYNTYLDIYSLEIDLADRGNIVFLDTLFISFKWVGVYTKSSLKGGCWVNIESII